MQNISHNLSESFSIQVTSSQEQEVEASPKLNLSSMKIFIRFRKIIMKLLFSLPSNSSSAKTTHNKFTTSASRKRGSASVCDRFEPPKTSCSSYYSSHSHYNEAISDCIEFFNKSSQDDHHDVTGGMIFDDPDHYSGFHMV